MLKNLLLLLSFITVFSATVVAQNYTVEPIPAYGDADLDNPATDPDDVIASAHITNNTSDSLFLRWERIVNDKPDSWNTAVCDVNLCYFPTVSSKEFILPPNLSGGEMLVHAYPGLEPGGIDENGAVPGTAHVKIRITNLNDAADSLITEYNFTVTGSPIASISEVELKALKIFPNPASGYFRLTETQEIQQLVVYNILGRKVRTFDVTSDKNYNIGDLPNGVYLVGMIDRDQETVKTLRLQKH